MFCKFGKVRKTEETLADFLKNLSVSKKKKRKKIYHFTSVLCYNDMLRSVKGFAPRILMMILRKYFYIRWSSGRSPWVHEVNPGRDPSTWY